MIDAHQTGPAGSAHELADVVAHVTYKPGWSLSLADLTRPTEHLAGSAGTTLCIRANVADSGDPARTTTVEHWFEVPTATYDAHTWQRWVLDRILEVERHETMEYYRVNGDAVYFPAHGPGRNPYTIEKRT